MPGFHLKDNPYILTTDNEGNKLLLLNLVTRANYKIAYLNKNFTDRALFDRIIVDSYQLTVNEKAG